MMFNPMIQQYANAFRTQMDYDMNKARQGGLLNLQSYQPAQTQTQTQVSPLVQPQGEQTLFQRLQAGENWNSVMGK